PSPATGWRAPTGIDGCLPTVPTGAPFGENPVAVSFRPVPAAWGSPATEPPLVAAGGTAARGTPRGHEPAGVAAHPAVSRGSRGRAVTAVLESRRVSQPVRRLTRALGGDGGRGNLATQTIRRPLAVATQLVPLPCRPGGWC